MLAAVDQARVRKPVHVESALAEDEMDIKQQAMLSAKQQAASKMEVLQIPSEILSTSTEQTIQVSQVRSLLRQATFAQMKDGSLFPIHQPFLLIYIRSKELLRLRPRWILALPHPQSLISQFQKLLSLNLIIALR